MRYRSRPSPRGTPPSAHQANGLKVINYDVQWPVSIIGPRKFPRSNYFDQTVPRVHEVGGTIRGRRWLSFRARRQGVFATLFATGKARYPERSFMWSAVKRLTAKGKIQSRFNVTLKRSW
jgi:hypothetical protein